MNEQRSQAQAVLRVVEAGPFALLQDGGRFGVRHLGVTQGGALDVISLWAANYLLGNPLEAAVIEIALGGFALESESETTLALAGADLGATLDGEPLVPGRSFVMRPGQRLAFTQPLAGVRAYLAAPGGFAAPETLGSCATVVREGLGGLDGNGQALAKGDVLHCRAGSAPKPGRALPPTASLDLDAPVVLDMVLGAQIEDFDGRSLFEAFNADWQVDERADRMGVRLLGPQLRCHRETMVSEGIPLGAVQVPADGQPIVLMNDRQTIGGYPRLGALTPMSVSRLGQCLPGISVRLRPVSATQARRAYLALRAALEA
ncbi:5-oxoprolinase subunit C family protein [Phytohalomonas tamaricis]|uniref:5-oxoprolinase subunit C family protein n=1 Tax=Phytohalomonas tamaricis TaxID=2081032 RepID=UPI000D0B1D64|nr:biotin-dependent carboxyltransferase family protein [Phytohalomonas tamaricis]